MDRQSVDETMVSQLVDEGFLTQTDVHFAWFIARFSKVFDPAVFWGAALTSQSTSQGNACLCLSRIPDNPVLSKVFSLDSDAWMASLQKSPAVGSPGDFTPLILDPDLGLLYLHRFRKYESIVVDWIREHGKMHPNAPDTKWLNRRLLQLFPDSTSSDTDWQKIAAATAVLRQFCTVSGGPGTGKTTTVAKILSLLIEHEPEQSHRIVLAAPTGKAAARLAESIASQKKGLPCNSSLLDAFPEQAQTIHRVLGYAPFQNGFVHNAANPLDVSTLVIDEASMVDLRLMASIIGALPQDARLILLGDKNQLSSVSPGSVMGDICGKRPVFSAVFTKVIKNVSSDFKEESSFDESSLCSDCIVELKTNYRFDSSGGIGQLSEFLMNGKADEALTLMKNTEDPRITFVEVKDPGQLAELFGKVALEGYGAFMQESEPQRALALFSHFQILCAVRKGYFGVEYANSLVEVILKNEGLIEQGKAPWYGNRPIMITANDYNLGLFNGDIGVTGDNRVHFASQENNLRSYTPITLPGHETVFAMTVHKSQGSEFDQVVLILPPVCSPVVTRELLYTAVTRARKKVIVAGLPEVLSTAIKTRTSRISGLGAALWGNRQ